MSANAAALGLLAIRDRLVKGEFHAKRRGVGPSHVRRREIETLEEAAAALAGERQEPLLEQRLRALEHLIAHYPIPSFMADAMETWTAEGAVVARQMIVLMLNDLSKHVGKLREAAAAAPLTPACATGNWVLDVFKPLPEEEERLYRDHAAPHIETASESAVAATLPSDEEIDRLVTKALRAGFDTDDGKWDRASCANAFREELRAPLTRETPALPWLRARIAHWRTIEAANPWTSGNDGIRDQAERNADVLEAELKLLEAAARG